MANLWLILDVETTGLDPATAGVWQLGAVLWQEGRELDAFELLVRPEEQHWTEEHRALSRRISGLTAAEEEQVAQATPLAVALFYLWELLWWWDQPRVIATSYNCAFERAFLDAGPASLSEQARQQGIAFEWGPCLMRAAAARFAPERAHFSLAKACAALGLPWTGDHRALSDARMAAQVGERLGVFTPSMPEE